MDDAKLPDLNRLRDNHEPKPAIPPQSSAQDTSNWEDRAFSTPEDTVNRELTFVMQDDDSNSIPSPVVNPYLEQERFKAENRSKKKNL